MVDAAHMDRQPLLGRVLARALDPDKKMDYVLLLALAVWPIMHAWSIGAAETAGQYQGYLRRGNWLSLVGALPGALFLLRWAMGRIAPVLPPPGSETTAPLVELVDGREAQRAVYEALRRALLSPANLLAAFLVVAAAHVVDLWSLAAVYVKHFDDGKSGLRCEDLHIECDWSVMFLRGEITAGANLLLNVSAYTVQFVTLLIPVLFTVLMARHNYFFLRRVYQRRWVPRGEDAYYIHVDLNDIDKCFGFRKANEAFNTQILILVVTGLGLLISRVYNVALGEPPTQSRYFPDAGQWVIAVGWLTGFFVAAMPAAVKFLPMFPSKDRKRPERTLVGYLREFFSDDAWPCAKEPSAAEVGAVASSFAENAFWPTGDNRARLLFFSAFFVLIWILVPDPRLLLEPVLEPLLPRPAHGGALIVAGGGIAVAVAYGATRLVFYLLENFLRGLSDVRLVAAPSPPPVEKIARARKTGRIGASVFISYRKAGSGGHAGHLYSELSKHVEDDRIFFDDRTIQGGEDWANEITGAIAASDVMVVLIDESWLTVQGETGKPRITDPLDWVHQEIVLALKNKLRIIPVLIEGASLPAEDDLPEPLRDMLRAEARRLTNGDWDYEVEKVIAAIAAAPRRER